MKFVLVFTILMENLVTTSSKAMELTSLLCITLCQQYFLWYFMAGKIVLVFSVQPLVNTVARIPPLKLAKLSTFGGNEHHVNSFFIYLRLCTRNVLFSIPSALNFLTLNFILVTNGQSTHFKN